MAASLWWSRCSCHFIGCLHLPVPISIPLRIYKKLKNIDLRFPHFEIFQATSGMIPRLGMHRNDNTNRSSGYFFCFYWIHYVHLGIGFWTWKLLAWGFCDFLSMARSFNVKLSCTVAGLEWSLLRASIQMFPAWLLAVEYHIYQIYTIHKAFL